MRRLKDLYPCVTCGVGVVVRCRAEIESARCAACSEYQRLLSSSALALDLAYRLYEKHRAAHSDVLDGAPFWLESAEHAIKGARLLVKAASRTADAAERAKWVRIAVSWSQWAARVNERATARLHEAAGDLLAVRQLQVELRRAARGALEPRLHRAGRLRRPNR